MWLNPIARPAPNTRHSIVHWRSVTLAAVMVALAGSDTTDAQRSSPGVLAGATGLRCGFTVFATGSWQDGVPRAQVREATLSIAFQDIDTQDGFATAVGTFGPSNIIVRFTAGSLHFMQVEASGAVYVTTVFSRETRGGRLQAVHTRHEYTEVTLPGFTSRPEQYYGDCEVEPKRPPQRDAA